MSNHLYDAIVKAIPSRDKTLIELADGKTISYGEMFAFVEKLAGHLARSGVVAGDRVAVQADCHGGGLVKAGNNAKVFNLVAQLNFRIDCRHRPSLVRPTPSCSQCGWPR